MRKMFAVAMMLAMAGAVGFTQNAEAGVTYDFAFRNTDGSGGAIAGGSAINGGKTFTFTSVTAANAAGSSVVMDVILRTTDLLFFASTSVMWDDSNGLAVGGTTAWGGVAVAFNMMNGVPTQFMSPLGSVNCVGNQCSSFNGAITPPNAPPSLPVGTYNIGSVVWNTSGMTASSAVMTFLRAGFDATGGVIGNAQVDLTGTEKFEMGFISIVPEPATAGLLGFGLAGLVLAGRRRRA